MTQRPYRGKRLDNGKWATGHYLTRRTQDHGLQHMISVQDMWGFHEVDPDTVGQYTGKQDVRDIKIFKGDLWEYGGVKYIVEWDDADAKFYFRNPHKNATWDDHISLAYSFEGTVVGSIHDHPHLLKGEGQ